MSDYIKKYWFVTLVGVLFFIAIAFFALNNDTEDFKGKTIDGKDVIFEYNDIAVTADDLYDEMFDDHAADVAYNFIQAATIRNAFEPDQDLLSEASLIYDNYLSYYKSQYGEEYESYLLPSLKALGYSTVEDLEEYILVSLMLEELNAAYINDNIDELSLEFFTAKAPRIISHILVMCEDPDAPTADESARMAEIDAAFANGETFASIAEKYSDDSSASNGGRFGYADLDSSLDEGFSKAAFAMDEGEISEWVKSQYGYHLIQIDSIQLDDLLLEDGFMLAVTNYYNLSQRVIWSEYQKRDIDYHGNDELKQQIESMLRYEKVEVAQ
ncbi:MAG: peptidylprolyl isomerase [Erysipelotrichaceae bacterium]|nr:peptidylprolyl isomerase [Erysipelotrichaceae bacterium]MDD3924207.1 peptidylprolyl isomerase [Erysipelotrichaceae bacterium]MDD4642049.1 peptidylprolyl isomerase [Erysipelotrichaceae bacterium]